MKLTYQDPQLGDITLSFPPTAEEENELAKRIREVFPNKNLTKEMRRYKKLFTNLNKKFSAEEARVSNVSQKETIRNEQAEKFRKESNVTLVDLVDIVMNLKPDTRLMPFVYQDEKGDFRKKRKKDKSIRLYGELDIKKVKK